MSATKLRNLAVTARELALAWGDGHESYVPFERLRRACPCALCQKEEGAVAGKGPDPFPTIQALVPVGAYAVQVVWSDGHDTGIYAFDTLRRLCPCPDCARSENGQ